MGKITDVVVFIVGGTDAVNQLSSGINGSPIRAAGSVIGTASSGAQAIGSIIGTAPAFGAAMNATGLAGTVLSAVQLKIDLNAGESLKVGDVFAVGVGIPVAIAIGVGAIGVGSILIPVGAFAAFAAAAFNLGGFTLDDIFKLFPSDGSPLNGADRQVIEKAIATALPLSSQAGVVDSSAITSISLDTNTAFLAAKSWTPPRDPLVLDGDGIETAGIDPTAPVLFDMDGDGIKTATGWIRPDDGIVVLDRNGNGLIDSGRELFGDATVLARGARAGQLAANGFEALADLDLNADGRLDSLDASWGQLRIWRDLNQDGVSQAGELTTLAAQGIARLGAQGTQSNVNLGGGNTQVMSGSFTRTNGMLGTSGVAEVAGSLLLASNNFYRDFTDEVALTPAAQSLPQMQGSGMVRDLREAMSLDMKQAGAFQTMAGNASNRIAPESIADCPRKTCVRARFDARNRVCKERRLIQATSKIKQRVDVSAKAFM